MNAPIRRNLSLFFPAHNERENIEKVTRAAVDVCSRLDIDSEIIIVDDGSTDGTGELADRLASEYLPVRVVHHEKNRGYGGALQSGFRSSQKELVFYTDGDGQFDLADLVRILPMIDNADVVTCYRMDRKDPWYRRMNTWLFEKAIMVIFGLRVKDPDCAFKIYRRRVLDSIELTSEGAMIDVEMLLQAQRKGFRIVQTGVCHLPRDAGEASGGNPCVIFRAMREMFRLMSLYGIR